jgi:hypothetical protein
MSRLGPPWKISDAETDIRQEEWPHVDERSRTPISHRDPQYLDLRRDTHCLEVMPLW